MRVEDLITKLWAYKGDFIGIKDMIAAVDAYAVAQIAQSQCYARPQADPLPPSIAVDTHYAAEAWVFEENGDKWSNNDTTAGDNYSSFRAGAEYMRKRLGGNGA